MEERLVNAFNGLPREKTTPSGLPNHWHFSVRHVPLQPPQDLLHIVHVESGFIHTAGPEDILSLRDVASQAEVVVPLLLGAFVSGVHKTPEGVTIPDKPKFAPWQWSTNDEGLRKAVETKFRAVGVREELCSVDVGTETENEVSTESFFTLLNSIAQKVAPCGGCQKPGSSFPSGLQRCSRCRSAWYCSTACQKADWKAHKKDCKG